MNATAAGFTRTGLALYWSAAYPHVRCVDAMLLAPEQTRSVLGQLIDDLGLAADEMKNGSSH